ncbi:hypothetical protein BOO69_05890 [Sulfitobacter alexandrii]|uniref:DUF995 domain-containing protein n=1 Tax=Sulfitobacter alexandrii TaxID=1917485 RepID=A0A1J0WFB5_9RHOB|nr:hypothetical protein [Sulfitobacter alexandrii]APE43003.1 hypothetical protein BOO69_05890 [Sulfitobacter alexandrii]
MRSIALILASLLALPAAAQDLMTAEEFDAYTRGKTLFYGRGGTAYGAEVYHENRRVVWSFLDGDCREGEWYQDGQLICFVYEDNPDPQCWSFSRGTGGLIARFENDPQTTELYEARDGDEEMICLGPKVGV